MPAARSKHLPGIRAGIAAAALLCASPVSLRASDPDQGQAQAAGATPPCFFRRDWSGRWRPAPDARALYISASGRVYRLDLQTAYPLLQSAWAVLANSDSSTTICSPMDFRLVVSDRIGIHETVIVRRVTALTAAEAAALPVALRP